MERVSDEWLESQIKSLESREPDALAAWSAATVSAFRELQRMRRVKKLLRACEARAFEEAREAIEEGLKIIEGG